MEVIIMKTKISHLGRSTVSVILAVMMLLSTMLIGTISVNAADYFTVGDTLYLDISDANYDATADNAEFYIKFYEKVLIVLVGRNLAKLKTAKYILVQFRMENGIKLYLQGLMVRLLTLSKIGTAVIFTQVLIQQ